MRHRVVPFNRAPPTKVNGDLYFSTHFRRGIIGAALDEMQPCHAAFGRVGDSPDVGTRVEFTRITDLSAQLRIRSGAVEHHSSPVLELHHLEHMRLRLQGLVPHETRGLHRLDLRKLDHLFFLRRTRTRPLLLHQSVKTRGIHTQSRLARHQLGEVQREPRGVVQLERKRSVDLAFPTGAQLRGLVLEERNAAVERLVESLFLTSQHLLNNGLPGPEFGKHLAHVPRKHVHQLVKKRFTESQNPAVTHRPPQNPTQHVIAIVITGLNAVRDREGKRADMISDHAERDVDLLLLAFGEQLSLRVRMWKRACVPLAAHFFELVENGAEDIRLIVRDADIGELREIFGALDDRAHALKTHSRVDVLRWQRRE